MHSISTLWLDDGPPSRLAALLLVIDEKRFDGNGSSAMRNWVFPTPEWDGMTESAMDSLMELTAEGHLSWAVFVPKGYRV